MIITIGETIKKLRNQKGVTQEKLAENLRVTPQAISRWESGAGCPAIEYLPNLAGFFGITVDELLGVKLSEREARRESIYTTIDHIEDCGYNPTAIDLLREAHAEFPSDMKISLSLAKALCSVWQEENPDRALLREAEKMLRDLIRKSDDYDFRFACVRELAVLYKEAWKDEQGYAEVVKMLPSLASCREIFITDSFNGAIQPKAEVQECIVTLVCHTVNILRDHVAYSLPNENDTWNRKIGYLEWLLDIYDHVTEIVDEEKALGMESSIAALYRYIATYYAAEGKKDETLQCLEAMTAHVAKYCGACPKDKQAHNLAWYFLPYLGHERYDAVRDDSRFRALKEKLEALAV